MYQCQPQPHPIPIRIRVGFLKKKTAQVSLPISAVLTGRPNIWSTESQAACLNVFLFDDHLNMEKEGQLRKLPTLPSFSETTVEHLAILADSLLLSVHEDVLDLNLLDLEYRTQPILVATQLKRYGLGTAFASRIMAT